MKTITEIDKNFENKSAVRDDIKVYNVRQEPFDLYGLYKPREDGFFRRVPEDVATATSEKVQFLSMQTAGGRVRFKTDSRYVVVKVVFPELWVMPNMALTGSAGFDLYVGKKYYQTFAPKFKYDDGTPIIKDYKGYENIIEFPDEQMRDITINFPLYNRVEDVFIGLAENAKLEHGNEYTYKKPVVFYGSSITQGGCASRPGCSYQSVLSRRFDFDFINLGFSGSALGEDSIAEYIASLDMSLFVYDYDHNADVARLRETHYNMYKKIRDAHPDMPIVMLSRPNFSTPKTIDERIRIILDTMEKGKAEGDNNIYFINGQDVFNRYDSDIFNVDGCHPNDFGFYCMADAIADVIGQFFKSDL